jgi:hypothetical protein
VQNFVTFGRILVLYEQGSSLRQRVVRKLESDNTPSSFEEIAKYRSLEARARPSFTTSASASVLVWAGGASAA